MRSRAGKRRDSWWLWLCTSAVCASLWQLAHSAPAFADAPAITDFGVNAVEPVWQSTAAATALFLTIAADGPGDYQVREVHNDAIAAFAGEHPAWRHDVTMSWLLQMPVYVREIQQDSVDGRSDV